MFLERFSDYFGANSFLYLLKDNADSYNVDTEVFTVAFSKKHPESIKINPIPKFVTKKKEEVVCIPFRFFILPNQWMLSYNVRWKKKRIRTVQLIIC